MPQTATDAANTILEQEHEIELVWSIADEAERRFRLCGRPDDFCFQSGSGLGLVFGGWNRIVWTARHGWQLSRSHCSPDFVLAWESNEAKGWDE